jgi:NADPH-dependent 2,4-dienoyl-CoA reductase/sulfur reductase-like enzyme
MCAAAAELEHSCGPGLPRTLVPVGMNARIVVGEGPAALEAVRAYREAGPGGDVVLVSADEHLPYNRPPLSKDFLRALSYGWCILATGASPKPLPVPGVKDRHGPRWPPRTAEAR